MSANRGEEGSEAAPARPGDVPDIAGLLRRLRQQNNMSLKELGEASDLSPSFLGAVERGDSDIAVQRLARVAAVFGHDVGSLLGYSLRSVAPRIISAEDRFSVDRGDGVTYEVMRIREIDFELVVATLAPGSAFREAISHAGLDVLTLVEGAIIIEYEGLDFPVKEGQTTVFAGSHPHRLRNDEAHPARLVAMTTARMY